MSDYELHRQAVGKYAAVVCAEQDGYPFNPREDDNIGTMTFWGYITRSYALGDVDMGEYPQFITGCERCDGTGLTDKWEVIHDEIGQIAVFDSKSEAEAWHDKLTTDLNFGLEVLQCPLCGGFGEYDCDPDQFFENEHDAAVVLPLSIRDYGSGGLYVKVAHDFVDADGAIHASWGTIIKWYGTWNGKLGDEIAYSDPNETGEGEPVDWWKVIEHDIPERLRSEVERYDAWSRNEVYYWAVIDEHGDTIEACGGYIGDEDAKYALSEAVASAKHQIEKDEREAREARYWMEREVVTI